MSIWNAVIKGANSATQAATQGTIMCSNGGENWGSQVGSVGNLGKPDSPGTIGEATSDTCNTSTAAPFHKNIASATVKAAAGIGFKVSSAAAFTKESHGKEGTRKNYDMVNLSCGNMVKTYKVLGFSTKCVPLFIDLFYNSQDTYSGPLGRGWTFAYNFHLTENPSTGDVTVKNATGSESTYTHPTFTPPSYICYTPPPLANATLTKLIYKGFFNQSFILEYLDGGKMFFNDAGRLIALIDTNGNRINANWASDRIEYIEDVSSGKRVTFTYNLEHRINTFTGPDDGTFTIEYQYNPLNYEVELLHKIVDPIGGVTLYDYNRENRIRQKTDSAGNITQYTYDDADRVTQVAFRPGESDGSTISYSYDAQNLITTVEDQDGKIWTAKLSTAGQMEELTDPMGNIDYYRYNRGGQLVQVEDPTGRITSWMYLNNQIASVTSPSWNTTGYMYDDNQNLVMVSPGIADMNTDGMWVDTYGSEGHILCAWDNHADVVSLPDYISSYNKGESFTACTQNYADNRAIENPSRSQKNFSYWFNNDNFTITLNFREEKTCNLALYSSSGSGGESSWTAQTLKVTDKRGTQFYHIPCNENGYWLNFQVEGDLNHSVTVEVEHVFYAAACNIGAIMFDPPRGNIVRMEHDSHRNLTAVKDAYGNGVTITYNNDGTPATVTDALGRVTSCTCDGSGSITSLTDPMENTVEITYDAMGKPLTMKDAKGNITTAEYGDNGRLVKLTDSLGNFRRFAYDAIDNLVALFDEKGRAVRATYDNYSRLVSIKDVYGNISTFTYDIMGNPVSMTDPLGRTMTYAYDNAHRLNAVTYPDEKSISITRDGAGRILTVTRPDGGVTRSEYDADGQVAQVTYPDGSVNTFEYDRYGNLSELTDGNGRTTRYFYDLAGRPSRVIDPAGGITTYNYFEGTVYGLHKYGEKTYGGISVGNLKSVTDAGGSTTFYEHDENSRLVKTTYPDGATEEFEYDENSNVTKRTDGKGNDITYTWDDLDRLTLITYPDETTMSFEYDLLSNLVKRTDPDGTVTQFEYDAADRLRVEKKRESANGALTYGRFFGYDKAGRMTTFEDTTWALKWNEGKYGSFNKYGENLPVYGQETAYGRTYYTSKRRFAQGAFITNYQLDEIDRLTTLTDAEGRETGYSFDDDMNVGEMTYPNGVVATATYDTAGKLLSLTYAKDSTVISSYEFTYDNNGNKLKVEQHDGACLRYSYDSLDQLTDERRDYDFTNVGTADFLEGTSSGVDVHSAPGSLRLLPLIDTFSNGVLNSDVWNRTESNKGKIELFGGRMIAYLTAQDTNASSASLDTNGKLMLTGDFDVTLDFELLAWSYRNRSEHLGFSFNTAGSFIGIERLTHPNSSNYYVGNANGSLQDFGTSDRIGKFRLARESGTVRAYFWNWSSSEWTEKASISTSSDGYLSFGMWTDQGYENEPSEVAFDNLSIVKNGGVTNPTYGSVSYPSGYPEGTFISAAYDAGSSVNFSKIFWSAGTPTGASVKFQVAANNDNAAWSFIGPDGTSSTYFTTSGASLPASCEGKRYIKYKAWLTTTDPTVTPAVNYVHIPVNTTTDQNPIYRIQYTFDAVGNRTQMVNNGLTTNYTYDAMNKMLSAGSATFTWDDNGNMLTKTIDSSTTTFDWDNEDRLTKVTMPDEAEVAYEYDGVGRMISRSVNDVKTTFHHQGIDAIAEVLPSGEVDARYTMAGGIISMHNADTPHYFHSSAIGSIETVTDAHGNVEATYTMDAYGNLISSTGTLDNDFRFVGAYGVRYDAITGLYYMRARWYDAECGRFMGRDILGSPNTYEYSYNNPIEYTDINGLEPRSSRERQLDGQSNQSLTPEETKIAIDLLTSEPRMAESMIPVWGPARAAAHDFKSGNTWWGVANTAMSISDMVPIKAAAGAVGKGLWKFGSNTWSATGKWLTKRGWREYKGQNMHHWLIPRNKGWGKYVPGFIKNQPWNLMPMSRQKHMELEYEMNFLEQFLNGTPFWFKTGLFSIGGRIANRFRGGNATSECD